MPDRYNSILLGGCYLVQNYQPALCTMIYVFIFCRISYKLKGGAKNFSWQSSKETGFAQKTTSRSLGATGLPHYSMKQVSLSLLFMKNGWGGDFSLPVSIAIRGNGWQDSCELRVTNFRHIRVMYVEAFWTRCQGRALDENSLIRAERFFEKHQLSPTCLLYLQRQQGQEERSREWCFNITDEAENGPPVRISESSSACNLKFHPRTACCYCVSAPAPLNRR